MKCTIPEISWHNRDPVLTVDIQNCSQTNTNYHLATGGTDAHVVIWQLNILENGGVSVEMLSVLSRHNRAVNAVRFSPSGQILASSDDEAAIILWKKNEDSNDIFIEESEKDNKEHWNVLKMLRCHIEDVYDLCWSSCSQFLISGSVDNTAILWDVHKGKTISILNDHKGFVQGVAWDPKGQLVATLSSDRFLRTFNLNTKKVVHRVYKATLPFLNPSEDTQKSTRLFYDDTLKSFCRRLSFSPDGELLVAPSGILEDGEGKHTNVTHMFLRSCLNRPVMCLPTHEKYTIAVRFCPQLFELRKINSGDDPADPPYTKLFNLPYRMVFALATQNAVLMYDTQQPIPFAKVSNIHYTRLSDVSWSSDGRILIVSSTDGYCSLVSFAEGELGTPYSPPEVPDIKSTTETGITPSNKKSVSEVEPMCVDEDSHFQNKIKIETERRPNKREDDDDSPKNKVAMPIPIKRKPGKRMELITLSSNGEKPSVISNSTVNEAETKKEEESCGEFSTVQRNISSGTSEVSVISTSKTPRRVSLITLSSPKSNKNVMS